MNAKKSQIAKFTCTALLALTAVSVAGCVGGVSGSGSGSAATANGRTYPPTG